MYLVLFRDIAINSAVEILKSAYVFLVMVSSDTVSTKIIAVEEVVTTLWVQLGLLGIVNGKFV